MALYTAILGYKGGTYATQIRANSKSAAFLKWLKTINQHGIPGIGAKMRDRSVREVLADRADPYPLLGPPALLAGLHNVWYCSLPRPFSSVTACLNIVQTEQERQAPLTTRFSERRKKRAAAEIRR